MKKLVSLSLVLTMMTSAADCTNSKKTDAVAPVGTTGASGETAGESSGSPSGDPVTPDLVTGSTGTPWYSYGATFSEVIPKGLPADSMINAIAEGGVTSNPIQVVVGAYQMGIGYSLSDKWACSGENLYIEAYDNLRGIAGYLDTFYYIALARTDAGWTDLAEVAADHTPIKINVPPAGNTGSIAISMILEYYGMTFDSIIFWDGTIEYVDWGTSVENVKDGRADFACHNIIQGRAAVTELSSTVDTTSIQFPQEMINTLTGEKGLSPETPPANRFKGRDVATDIFGVTSSLFYTTDMPDNVAYDIAKALCENVDDVKAGHTTLQRFTVEEVGDLAGMDLPSYPDTEKCYKEAGMLD